MKVERTFDYDLIMSIAAMPEFDVCIEDGMSLDSYVPDKNSAWLLVTDNNDIIGLARLKPLNSIALELHPQILKKHRAKYNKTFFYKLYEWVEYNAQQYEKINAEAPVIYPHLKRFMCSIGFSLEGVNRKSHIKNGEIVDKWVFGITKEEFKKVIV